jgi:hypothetical protein
MKLQFPSGTRADQGATIFRSFQSFLWVIGNVTRHWADVQTNMLQYFVGPPQQVHLV